MTILSTVFFWQNGQTPSSLIYFMPAFTQSELCKAFIKAAMSTSLLPIITLPHISFVSISYKEATSGIVISDNKSGFFAKRVFAFSTNSSRVNSVVGFFLYTDNTLPANKDFFPRNPVKASKKTSSFFFKMVSHASFSNDSFKRFFSFSFS